MNALVGPFRAAIQTAIASVVAWLVLRFGIDMDGDSQKVVVDAVSVGVATGAAFLYWAVVTALSKKWPWLQILLGWPSKVEYKRLDEK